MVIVFLKDKYFEMLTSHLRLTLGMLEPYKQNNHPFIDEIHAAIAKIIEEGIKAVEPSNQQNGTVKTNGVSSQTYNHTLDNENDGE
jgi:hypothetical protein